jgi:hypothetical protein
VLDEKCAFYFSKPQVLTIFDIYTQRKNGYKNQAHKSTDRAANQCNMCLPKFFPGLQALCRISTLLPPLSVLNAEQEAGYRICRFLAAI